jgi:hypothetical protein
LRVHLCKFATGVNNIGGKLSVVSTTLAVNLGHQWQILGTISVYLHLKVKLKEKVYLYVYFTTQKFKKKINTFLIEVFFYLPPVSNQRKVLIICHLPFETVRMGYSGAWRKLIHEKNMKSKIS